jgi:hypothetical protein
MTIPVPQTLLRGAFAQAYRSGIASPNSWAINKLLRQAYPNTYDAVEGSAVAACEQALRKGPYIVPLGSDFTFEYWYNYFFKELPTLRKTHYAVQVINDDGSFRGEASTPPAQWKDPNNKDWATLFSEMLALGFKAFTAADKLTAAQAFADAMLDKGNELQRRQVQVAFRGDGRLPDTIKFQRGTARQTQIEDLRRKRNIDKPWHPFKDQGYKVWLRNGANVDNCLFSVVSITPQFGVATKFPLLDDLRGSNPAALGHSVVRVRVRPSAGPASGVVAKSEVARGYQASVQAQQGVIESRVLLASLTNIYCVRLRDVYDTQKFQGDAKFPEYAATRISWTDHLVWFGVTRIHYSDVDGNAGHLIVVTDHGWLQEPGLVTGVLLNPTAMTHLQAFTQDIVRRGSLRQGRGGISYVPPGMPEPPFEIVEVVDLFVPMKKPVVAINQLVPATGPVQAPAKKLVIPAAFTHSR